MAGQICGRNLADLDQKRAEKRAELIKKVVFLVLFSLILGKYKKYYAFPTTANIDKFLSSAQMS